MCEYKLKNFYGNIHSLSENIAKKFYESTFFYLHCRWVILYLSNRVITALGYSVVTASIAKLNNNIYIFIRQKW